MLEARKGAMDFGMVTLRAPRAPISDAVKLIVVPSIVDSSTDDVATVAFP